MNLFQRVSDILSANVNELVERYEDPELLLRQAVREMEEAIRAALESAVKVVAHEKLLARQLASEEAAAAAWRERAVAAVQQGDDAAAREALSHKRQREAVSASLAGQLTEATEAARLLRRQVDAMRRRVEEAKRKLTLLAARQRAAKARSKLLRELGAAPVGDEAFAKFDRMCRKVEQTEAEADALADLTGAAAFPLAACEISASDELEAELRELKSRCGV